MAEQEKGTGKMTVEEAGRKGGEKVAQERGSQFYSEIGRKGGQAHHEKRGAHGRDHEKNPNK